MVGAFILFPMYTTAQPTRYTAQELLSYVTQEEVFSELGFPMETVYTGKKCYSPFREDKHPDCRWNMSVDGKLRFLDPARGLSLDWLDAVAWVRGCSFLESLDWVRDTFIHGEPQLLASNSPLYPTPTTSLGTKKLIQIKRKPWDATTFLWWRQFNLGAIDLYQGNVFAISDYWIEGRHFSAPKLAFAYVEEDGMKLYFPENDHRYRFIGNTKVLFCYELLPQSGDLLLITSSKKDALCLRSFGYHAVAPQGEGMEIAANLLWELKQRFRKVILFYDNDEPGIALAAQKVARWQVGGSIMTPSGGPKDPADYCKTYGAAATMQLLINLTHEVNHG